MSHAQIMRALEQSLHGGCNGAGLVGGQSMTGYGLVGGADPYVFPRQIAQKARRKPSAKQVFMAQQKREGVPLKTARALWQAQHPINYAPESMVGLRRRANAMKQANPKCGPFGKLSKAQLIALLA